LFDCFRRWIDINQDFDGFVARHNKIRASQASLHEPLEGSVVGLTRT
jgi:hypothetical protein